jgi:outer membrane protein assembly factor BamB
MKKQFLKKIISFICFIALINIIPLVSSNPFTNSINLGKNVSPMGIDWWPMFHHTENQTGFSTSTAPNDNEVLWSYETDYFISSSPNVVDGKVFIGSLDKKFYCFDMISGENLWNFSTDGKITGSSAYYNGKVYFGSQDSNFYCLNAENGDEIWNYNTNFMIESSPSINSGKVYFGSSDGSFYCLDANNGSFIWEFSAGNVIWTSPAISEDRVYFGSLSGDLFCLDKTDGELKWTYSTTSGIWSSPALYNNKIYFGSNDNFVYCLNADNGNFVWSFDAEGEVHSSPAIAYGNVYIGSSGQGLFCLDAGTGELVWQYLINNGIWCSPAVADNKVYYGNDPCCGATAHFHCADAFTGEVIWIYSLGGEEGMKSSPAIAAGKVFIGAGNGKVFAFGGDELIADSHGPYNSIENEPIQFFGSAYGGKPEYSWNWDFGDGEFSDEQNPNHSYSTQGKYTVTLKVEDRRGNIAIDETIATIERYLNYPPETPVINGPIDGKEGEEYTYCISDIFDPNNDNIYVLWDWGDDTNNDWIGPFSNGDEICENHIWNEQGSFTIKAKLKDEYGMESNWGYLDVNIPRSKIISRNTIINLFDHHNFDYLIQKILFYLFSAL